MVEQEPRRCDMCGKEIPLPRIEAQPNTLTCSKQCSKLRKSRYDVLLIADQRRQRGTRS